jgi:hypothetical protein
MHSVYFPTLFHVRLYCTLHVPFFGARRFWYTLTSVCVCRDIFVFSHPLFEAPRLNHCQCVLCCSFVHTRQMTDSPCSSRSFKKHHFFFCILSLFPWFDIYVCHIVSSFSLVYCDWTRLLFHAYMLHPPFMCG